MMVIITGENHIEICVPNKKEEGLHFFKTKNQLYRIFPNGMCRVRLFDYGGMEVGSESGIIYRENDTIPYDPLDLDYTMDRLLSDVDRHKMMRSGGLLKKPKIWFSSTVGGIWNWLFSKVGITGIIVGAILIYAFLAPRFGA